MFFKIFCAATMAFGVFSVANPLDAKIPCNSSGVRSDCSKESAKKLGRKLVEQLWRDVKYQRVHAYSALLADNFKGLSESGHYSRHDQIVGFENATLIDFDIRRLTAERYGDSLVVSYNFVAESKGLTSGPNIDFWHKIDCKWTLVGHSYVPFLH
ncbi:MAG: nuclear transport factor 2 family protein [Parachlamydiaceae bacterium]|nr:nuclear transport factor 2 family protein [Parachlamydiaceae bacterium]